MLNKLIIFSQVYCDERNLHNLKTFLKKVSQYHDNECITIDI